MARCGAFVLSPRVKKSHRDPGNRGKPPPTKKRRRSSSDLTKTLRVQRTRHGYPLANGRTLLPTSDSRGARTLRLWDPPADHWTIRTGQCEEPIRPPQRATILCAASFHQIGYEESNPADKIRRIRPLVSSTPTCTNPPRLNLKDWQGSNCPHWAHSAPHDSSTSLSSPG